jgi:hypothetical protein
MRSRATLSLVTVIALVTIAASPLPTPPPTTGSAGAPTSTLSTVIDNVQKVAQIVGILAAGIWAYYLFFRGRTFQPRLEPTLEASVMQLGPARYLKAKARVKNVGLSKVTFDRSASGFRVFTIQSQDAPTAMCPVEWNRERTLDVFKDHDWIEPGETIEDNWLLSLPTLQQHTVFRLEIKLAGAKTDWYASAMVELAANPTSRLHKEV